MSPDPSPDHRPDPIPAHAPPGPPPAADLLHALGRADLALGAVDDRGRLGWCSAALAACFEPPPAPGQPLHEVLGPLLGPDDIARLRAGQAVVQALPDGRVRHWQLDGGPAEPWRWLQARTGPAPAQEVQALQDQVQRLQERLDLVQGFSRTGIFERDPVTLTGEWDAQMYRIWGLAPPAEGCASPAYATVSAMMFEEDRQRDAFVHTMESPGAHAQRVRIRRPDGQVRHLHTQWKVFHDAQGRPRRVLGVNTDDTEVYELATRAERLRTELDAALELGHIAVWQHTLGSDRLLLDPRGCAVIGVEWSPAGVPVEEARARIHPDDRHLPGESAEYTLRTGVPSDMELRYPRPDGGWKHVLLRRALQRGTQGEPLGFIGVMLDVTERVESHRRALDLARRLEAAAEAARIGLWSSRPGSLLPDWNGRMYELLGLDPAAGPLTLRDWLARCVHPDDAARVRSAALAWWHQGGSPLEIEFRIVRPSDGQQRWLVVRGAIDSRGGPEGDRRAEGVAIDITTQQQTLRQLRETIERMTLTNAALGLGTWEADRDHREIRWDAQMFRLRGVESPARVIDRLEIASYLHPDDRQRVMTEQVEHLHDGQPWHREFRIQRPDGEVRWITSQSVPIPGESGPGERRIGVNWDSTEAHVATDALRQRELALAESQAKSQTMSRISHELRTPLNAVLGFAQLLRGPQGRADSDRRERWLSHIDEAGRHLLGLIDDVLELSRAEASERQLSQKAVTLPDFVDATLPLVASEAQARQVVLQRGPVAGAVLADSVRLRQVLINLLSNAIKYNRPGGRVLLSAEVEGAQVALRVADTGLGIAPDRLRHAFEPFNRLGAEDSAIEGSGIGLAIVKVLVEHMGGTVQARSQPGQGSEFTVRLPLAPPDTPPEGQTVPGTLPVTAPAPLDEGPPARVLYIEDNPVNALLVRELLADRPGVRLEVAETGQAGIRRAGQWQPDLILVDMHLPDIDGHGVLQALRADPRTAAIRCVALSANATPADLEAARTAGFADYWTKPIQFGRFLQELGGLIGRKL